MTAQQKDWSNTYFGGCVRQWPISSVYEDEHELGKHEEHVVFFSGINSKPAQPDLGFICNTISGPQNVTQLASVLPLALT